jgi:hypothetical protein
MLKTIKSQQTSQTAKLHNPSQINGDNLNNIKCEASRNFRYKKREYLKDKTHSKNKNI